MFEIKSITNTEKETEKDSKEYITTVLKSTTETSNIKKVVVTSKDEIGGIGQKLEIKLSNPQKTLK